jgi:hypothetical protein
VVALRIYDKTEISFPKIGLVKLRDNETGQVKWVDTSSREFQHAFKLQHAKHEGYLKETFSRAGVDNARISTHDGYIKPLMNLFKRRA